LTPAWHAERKQTLADAAEGTLFLCERIEGPLRLVGHSGVAPSPWPLPTGWVIA
jgi:hypothetical protein